MRFAVFVAIVIAFSSCASAQSTDPTESIVVNGVTRTYVIHVPPASSGRVPLVLAFHGHFGTGAGQERLSGLDAQSDRLRFIVVYPNGLDRGWNDGRSTVKQKTDDLGFVRALLDDLPRRYSIDPNRIYATGMSNGAMFTQYLACTMSDRIAAIAPVEGSLPVDDVASCHPQRAISVLEIAGTADPIMPYEGGTIATFRGLGNGGAVLSARQSVAFWAKNAGCGATPKTTTLARIASPDGTSVAKTVYPGCSKGSAVEEYAVIGGGHTWPGGRPYAPKALIGITSRQLDASETIVEFFLAHRLR